MVLDGEMLLRGLLVEVLADAGLAVREAETVGAAREMLREQGTRLLVYRGYTSTERPARRQPSMIWSSWIKP